MKEYYSKFNFFISIFLALLVISLPVTFAEQINIEEQEYSIDKDILLKPNQIQDPNSSSNVFLGLPAWLIAILTGANIQFIAIGVAVIAGGYIVYHVAQTTWVYYKAYSYSKLVEYKHINQFPNIWKKTPSRKQFEKKCKDNMNSKSSERYVQTVDGRNIAYNPSTKMITVGDINGKTIITCFPKDRKDVDKEVSKGRWKKIK